jgi:ADP-heptose:LPS heptosyltransferase
MKILVISLAGIGDTLIATPLIHELRLNYPEATLDAFVFWPGARDLLEGNPYLSEVYQRNLVKEGLFKSLKFLFQLRKEKYDVSINVHPQSRIHYRVVARLINAPIRVSHDYDNSTSMDRLLVNRTVPQDYSIHSIENNLRLLTLLGKRTMIEPHDFELFLSKREIESAEDFVRRHQLSTRRLVGVHVGSGKTKNLALKRWPLANYLELIKRITKERPDLTVLLFGGSEEKEENEILLREIQHPCLIPARTGSLREAAALLRKCEAFVSVDNALMHFAAAMNVPKHIIIESPTFGPTIAPYRRQYFLVENPAVHGRNLEFYRYDGRGIRGSRETLLKCMTAVTVDDVYRVFLRAIDSPTNRRS